MSELLPLDLASKIHEGLGKSKRVPDGLLHCSSDPTEIAWAAGFFDGEGSIGAHYGRHKKYPYPTLGIAQVDRRPLDRFAATVGIGNILGPYKHKTKPHHSPFYEWHIEGKNVKAVLELLWPFISDPKKEKWADVQVRIGEHYAR